MSQLVVPSHEVMATSKNYEKTVNTLVHRKPFKQP